MGYSDRTAFPPQHVFDLLSRKEQAAAYHARDITPLDPHALMRASRAQGTSGPSSRRIQAALRPARPRRSRPIRANRSHVGPIVAVTDVDENAQANVPDPSQDLDSREIRLARRVRRREEAEAAAALRRRG